MPAYPIQRLTLALQWPITPLEDAIQWVRTIEDAGFEGIWAGDLHIDPFVVMATYAAATKTLKFGTSIAGWTRTPVAMANTVETMDRITGGRFRLGLGTMPHSYNQEWHSIDTSRMVRRMREYIEMIRLSLKGHSGYRPEYRGEIFSLTNYSRPAPFRDTVPIWLGVSMPQMTRLAGRVADGVFFHPIHTLPYLREVLLPDLEAGAKASGRTVKDLEITPSLICSISPDRAEAIRWAKAHIAFYVKHQFLYAVFDHAGFSKERAVAAERMLAGDLDGAIAAIPDELAQLIAVAGTPDDCRKRLADYADFATVPRLVTVRQNVPPAYVEATYQEILKTFGK